MKNVIFKSITLSVLVIIGLGTFSQADTKVDAKDKVESVKKKASIKNAELPELKLEVLKSDKKIIQN